MRKIGVTIKVLQIPQLLAKADTRERKYDKLRGNLFFLIATVRPRDTRPQAARTSTMHVFE